MKTNALSIVIPAPQQAVLHCLADIDNVPKWATEFCKQLIQDHNHDKVLIPMEELYLRIRINEDSGEIKYFASTETNDSEYIPSKVTQINDSRCKYMINFSQSTGLSDEFFQQQCSAIKIKLQNIQNNFENHH